MIKWRIYKEDVEEGAFKVGDRVQVADTYKGKPTTGGRFSDDPPSPGMTGTVVDINRQRYHDFKFGSMGLGMSREKTRMWYVVKIDDSCRKGCFVPGEYGFDEKDLVKIDAVNESDEGVNLKKLLRQNGVTKLPSGTEFRPDSVSWSKDGGYAGQKTLDKICSQLEDAGWKRGDWRTGGIPDGSAVSNSNAYTSPDGQIVMTYSEHYGATAYDNFYGFTFKLAGGQVNEGDEKEDTFTRSKRPQIYKYYADDVTPVEEFVKHVHSTEHMIEDIFIQNGDYYTSMPKEEAWDAFADDMCQGEQPEKALDLDYYMNLAAVDELPEDIKKYVNTSYGSGDFDAVQWLYGIFERLMPICKDPVGESSRFGFNIGDKVELKVGKEPNRFGGWGKIEAGSQGEIVAIDKPMPGAIKVKLEDGTVVTMGERQLKLANTDNEPWKTLAANRPPEPKRHVRPERPEDYYMRPTSYGSPRYTGD